MRPTGVNVSRKGIFAVALLAISLIAVSGVSINRALSEQEGRRRRPPSGWVIAPQRLVATPDVWT